MVVHDVFGVDSGRTKAICDQFAQAGYVVLMPNAFRRGAFADANVQGVAKICVAPRMIAFLRRYTWDVVGPLYEDVAIPYLRTKGVDTVGLVGFCWGAYPVTRLLATTNDLFKAGLCFHPSLQVFTAIAEFGLKARLSQCHVPLAYLSARSDPGDVKPGGFADRVARENNPLYSKCLFKKYPDMIHGWVNRGDLGDATVERDVEDALRTAITFLDDALAAP